MALCRVTNRGKKYYVRSVDNMLAQFEVEFSLLGNIFFKYLHFNEIYCNTDAFANVNTDVEILGPRKIR